MIPIIELFDRDNILCPDWLVNSEALEDEWLNSIYSYEDNKHTWSLKTQFKNVKITFDGEEYQFLGYHPEHEDCVIFRNVITEEYELIT